MRYLLLIHDEEAKFGTMSQGEIGKLMTDYNTFTEELIKSGSFKDAARLRPTATATTVRVRDGKTLTTDGPFAETKEQLGGYYLVDVKNLDEAIKWAAKIPSARLGSVEVRPVWEDGE
ncbi:MAG TPA: YciI family protein [Candidatus Polarisedimenticolia bacterium]|nr:YciI family protein [Candidatus Polarisedimenticolia bacterium]